MTRSTVHAADTSRPAKAGAMPALSVARPDAIASGIGPMPASYTVSSGADVFPRLHALRAWLRRVTRLAA